MELKRLSGILAHPTSFPGKYGIGDLGEEAYLFVDFLAKAGQSLWQVLPLGPTSYGDSPYQSFSTFAGNHYLISPDILSKEGYLKPEDLLPSLLETKIREADDPDDAADFNPCSVNYGPVIKYKMELYRRAFARFCEGASSRQISGFTEFCDANRKWLDDYSLFVALKDHFIQERRNEFESPEYLKFEELNKKYLTKRQTDDYYYGAVWNSWPDGLRAREKGALSKWRDALGETVRFHKFLQYEFFREWDLLKKYAEESGVAVIGDIPIFVAMDSSDVWAEPELFHLDQMGYPTSVAGVPPDYFSETGQLWGNPLYNWPVHKKTGYAWWVARIKSTLKTVDILRIDHFRGFESYWSVPYGEKTALKGKWVKGPGIELFEFVSRELGGLPIIAEDLGIITEEVTALRKKAGLPGMKVLQFAFGSDNANLYLPHNFTDTDMVLYSGTHDNDTTMGWYAAAEEKESDYYRKYMRVSGEDAAWDLIRLAYSSTACYVITPIWDVMSLDGSYRMNTPGIATGNWRFRYTKEMLKDETAEGLLYLSELYRRNEREKTEEEEAEEDETGEAPPKAVPK